MIHFDVSDPNNLAVDIRCDRCLAVHRSEFDPPLMAPAASLEAVKRAIADGWQRNVPVPTQRMSIKSRDKEGRPDEIGQEPGTMVGDMCPDCIKATEAA